MPLCIRHNSSPPCPGPTVSLPLRNARISDYPAIVAAELAVHRGRLGLEPRQIDGAPNNAWLITKAGHAARSIWSRSRRRRCRSCWHVTRAIWPTRRQSGRRNTASGGCGPGGRFMPKRGPSAAGLAALGVEHGARVVIVGDNRPQLYWSICAAQALGGGARAGIPGSQCGGDGLRHRSCGGRYRHRRGSGTGR